MMSSKDLVMVVDASNSIHDVESAIPLVSSASASLLSTDCEEPSSDSQPSEGCDDVTGNVSSIKSESKSLLKKSFATSSLPGTGVSKLSKTSNGNVPDQGSDLQSFNVSVSTDKNHGVLKNSYSPEIINPLTTHDRSISASNVSPPCTSPKKVIKLIRPCKSSNILDKSHDLSPISTTRLEKTNENIDGRDAVRISNDELRFDNKIVQNGVVQSVATKSMDFVINSGVISSEVCAFQTENEKKDALNVESFNCLKEKSVSNKLSNADSSSDIKCNKVPPKLLHHISSNSSNTNSGQNIEPSISSKLPFEENKCEANSLPIGEANNSPNLVSQQTENASSTSLSLLVGTKNCQTSDQSPLCGKTSSVNSTPVTQVTTEIKLSLPSLISSTSAPSITSSPTTGTSSSLSVTSLLTKTSGTPVVASPSTSLHSTSGYSTCKSTIVSPSTIEGSSSSSSKSSWSSLPNCSSLSASSTANRTNPCSQHTIEALTQSLLPSTSATHCNDSFLDNSTSNQACSSFHSSKTNPFSSLSGKFSESDPFAVKEELSGAKQGSSDSSKSLGLETSTLECIGYSGLPGAALQTLPPRSLLHAGFSSAAISTLANGGITPTGISNSVNEAAFYPDLLEAGEVIEHKLRVGEDEFDCDPLLGFEEDEEEEEYFSTVDGRHSNENYNGISEEGLHDVPHQPIFETEGETSKRKRRSSLKRTREEEKDEADGDKSANTEDLSTSEPAAKRPKRNIKFEGVTVFYFPRSQGFSCVPSKGGSTLGMARRHFHKKNFSINEHLVEQRKFHKIDRLHKMSENKKSNSSSDSTVSTLGTGPSSDEDTEEDGSDDVSESELEQDISFLRPLAIRQRRSLLRESGIAAIESVEKEECKDIRISRELCGCQCKLYCFPETCQCIEAGIKCQVDRHNFPCGCSVQGCNNPHGRIEFNPIRVRTHFLHTLMRLEIEKRQAEQRAVFHQQQRNRWEEQGNRWLFGSSIAPHPPPAEGESSGVAGSSSDSPYPYQSSSAELVRQSCWFDGRGLGGYKTEFKDMTSLSCGSCDFPSLEVFNNRDGRWGGLDSNLSSLTQYNSYYSPLDGSGVVPPYTASPYPQGGTEQEEAGRLSAMGVSGSPFMDYAIRDTKPPALPATYGSYCRSSLFDEASSSVSSSSPPLSNPSSKHLSLDFGFLDNYSAAAGSSSSAALSSFRLSTDSLTAAKNQSNGAMPEKTAKKAASNCSHEDSGGTDGQILGTDSEGCCSKIPDQAEGSDGLSTVTGPIIGHVPAENCCMKSLSSNIPEKDSEANNDGLQTCETESA